MAASAPDDGSAVVRMIRAAISSLVIRQEGLAAWGLPILLCFWWRSSGFSHAMMFALICLER